MSALGPGCWKSPIGGFSLSVAQRFGLKPKRLAADTAYGNARTLRHLVAQGIEPHIPVIGKSTRNDGTLSRAEFQCDRERNLYVCPGGKEFKPTAPPMTAPGTSIWPNGATAKSAL